jgi:hypothetical protein
LIILAIDSETAQEGGLCADRGHSRGERVKKREFMPTDEKVLGFSNTWFVGGLENAIDYALPNGTRINVFAAPWFLAAKLQAYQDVIQSTAQDPDREAFIYSRITAWVDAGAGA